MEGDLEEALTAAIEGLPQKTEAERIVARICQEVHTPAHLKRHTHAPASSSTSLRLLEGEPRGLHLEVLKAALADHETGEEWIDYSVERFRKHALPATIIQKYDLLSHEEVLQLLLSGMLQDCYEGQHYTWVEYAGIGLSSVVEALENLPRGGTLSPSLRGCLENICNSLGSDNAVAAKFAARVQQLCDPREAARPFPPGKFASAFFTHIDSFPEPSRTCWTNLGQVAARSGRKAQPSRKWLTDAENVLEPIEAGEFVSEVTSWLDWRQTERSFDLSLDVLKGLIRMIPMVGGREPVGPLGRFCERYYKKAGPRSAELGLAALRSLFDLRADPSAVAELLRLKTVVRHKPGLNAINQIIGSVAQERNLSIGELEEQLLPNYGLTADSRLELELGEASATLTLSAVSTTTVWLNRAGKQVKSPPAEVKRNFKDELAAFKQQAKTIDKARKNQALRLERSWLENRSWAFPAWRASYLEHPLRRPIVSALIWQFIADENIFTAIPIGGKLIDIEGSEIEPSDRAKAKLWHPRCSSSEEVIAWRDRILALGLTQPIKQAHREIYVLTDAEKDTGTYSNRFAAHILRNHQLGALCKSQGWSYGVYFDLDYQHEAELNLADAGLKVKFHVEMVEGPIAEGSGAPLYVATDRVSFRRSGTYSDLELVQVPDTIFSEIMRDVDMFVAVASVANDPTWSDGGPDGRHRDYWHDWAFGELGQTAQVRRELIRHFAPSLSIADKLEIGEKALIVTGKRQDYAIHFGSTNVQILPDNRYLCIVPDRATPEADRVRLPFTGDSQVSTILAKAFMLVDEDRITDATILSQL